MENQLKHLCCIHISKSTIHFWKDMVHICIKNANNEIVFCAIHIMIFSNSCLLQIGGILISMLTKSAFSCIVENSCWLNLSSLHSHTTFKLSFTFVSILTELLIHMMCGVEIQKYHHDGTYHQNEITDMQNIVIHFQIYYNRAICLFP